MQNIEEPFHCGIDRHESDKIASILCEAVYL